ncbi:MAG TPA: MCE family protein, partial [Chromatiaceae bacterium]|nr:MCE family protein [Chromatiaceae bacterium]
KYRGVDVGTVTRMELAPDNPEHVMLTLHIRQDTPVTTDTRASIKFYGVTGLGYIELQGSNRKASALEAKDGEIPVIASVPSTFARLDEGLSELADKSARALDRIALLLNDSNLQSFSELLNESRLLVTELRKQTVHLGAFIDKGIVAEDKIGLAFEEVGSSASSVKKMSKDLRTTYVALGKDLQRQMSGLFTRLDQLLENLDVLSRQLQRSVSEFNAAPADLLFRRSSPRPGPGEKP